MAEGKWEPRCTNTQTHTRCVTSLSILAKIIFCFPKNSNQPSITQGSFNYAFLLNIQSRRPLQSITLKGLNESVGPQLVERLIFPRVGLKTEERRPAWFPACVDLRCPRSRFCTQRVNAAWTHSIIRPALKDLTCQDTFHLGPASNDTSLHFLFKSASSI